MVEFDHYKTMAKNKTINVKGTEITILLNNEADYISLTDIAKHKDAENTDTIVQNWLRNSKYSRAFRILGNNV